jgi:hypothetical protein
MALLISFVIKLYGVAQIFALKIKPETGFCVQLAYIV